MPNPNPVATTSFMPRVSCDHSLTDNRLTGWGVQGERDIAQRFDLQTLGWIAKLRAMNFDFLPLMAPLSQGELDSMALRVNVGTHHRLVIRLVDVVGSAICQADLNDG